MRLRLRLPPHDDPDDDALLVTRVAETCGVLDSKLTLSPRSRAPASNITCTSSLPGRTCPYSQPECRWRLSGVHACWNAGFSLLLTPGSKEYRVLHGIGSDQPAPVDRHQSPARQPLRGHRRSPKRLGDPVEQRRQPLAGDRLRFHFRLHAASLAGAASSASKNV